MKIEQVTEEGHVRQPSLDTNIEVAMTLHGEIKLVSKETFHVVTLTIHEARWIHDLFKEKYGVQERHEPKILAPRDDY